MKTRTTIATVIFVAVVMVVPACVFAVEPMGMIDEDGGDLICEYWEDSQKWLSNVTKWVQTRCYHGALGTFDAWLYDPDGTQRAHYTPQRNTVNPTIYKYNLNDYFNVTGKLAGQWHLHWHGHYDMNPIEGDDYMYVGVIELDRTDAVPYTYNEAKKLGFGLSFDSRDGYGVAASLGITFMKLQSAGTGDHKLLIRTAASYQDRKPFGVANSDNHIEKITLYISKVAWGGWGTTGTGSGGSWYNSGIGVDRAFGRNVTVTGAYKIDPLIKDWTATAIGGFVGVLMPTFAWLSVPAATFAASTVLNAFAINNPINASNHNGYSDDASCDYTRDADGYYNGTAWTNLTLTFDYQKSLSYAFKMYAVVTYYNLNWPALQLVRSTPSMYIVVDNH